MKTIHQKILSELKKQTKIMSSGSIRRERRAKREHDIYMKSSRLNIRASLSVIKENRRAEKINKIISKKK